MGLEEKYDRSYWEGRVYQGIYYDFPCNYVTAEMIWKKKPENVLEVGGARGFISKIIQSYGIPVTCMDFSEYCHQNRVVKEFVKHDATIKPYPFKDKEFDLCFSNAVLEHIPDEKIDITIGEIVRVSKRGIHGTPFSKPGNDIDPTHCSIHPKDWWINKFKDVAPDYSVEIVDQNYLGAYGSTILFGQDYAKPDGLVKLNIGTYREMFHYGWINIDILNLSTFARDNGYLFTLMDVRNGLQFGDNTVDIIYISHMLEHLERDKGKTLLQECYRVLKNGGIIRISVPDPKILISKYLDGSLMQLKSYVVESSSDVAEAFFQTLTGGHRTAYDFDSLSKVLTDCKFVLKGKMGPFDSTSDAIRTQTLTTHPELSLYVEAVAKI